MLGWSFHVSVIVSAAVVLGYTYLGGLTVHTAAATALFTFVFTGILGTILFQRRGSIDWGITRPVCAGAVIFSVLGAWAASRIEARPLALIIAAIVLRRRLGVGCVRSGADDVVQPGPSGVPSA